MTITAPAIDEEKLNAFLGKVVGDWGAMIGSALVTIGDRLGLYRAMAGAGPLTPGELAARTDTAERYVRDWLVNQAAGGYVEYDAATGRYTLPPEHALALTDEGHPAFVAAGFGVMTAAVKAEAKIADAIRTGGGLGWGEQDPLLFPATERFFRPLYEANLVQSWLPALDGAVEQLERGATVADVGCGHGASTIIMARAYPNSRFFGFDSHGPSIEAAQQAAEAAGLGDRALFAVASATTFPGGDYDLIAFFDCLHDMGDPVAVARHTRRALKPDGTALIVEPMAGRTVEENLNPVGRIFSAASVLICTPCGIADAGHDHGVLGTIATDDQIGAALAAGGFRRFRRATETPFNRVFEARP